VKPREDSIVNRPAPSPSSPLEETPSHGGLTHQPVPIHQVVHSLAVGGAEVLAVRLAEGLLPRFATRMLCLDETGPLEERLSGSGVRVEVLGRRPGLDRRCALRIRQVFRGQRPAAVLAHQFTPFFYAAWGRGLRGRPPLVFVEHGRFHPDRPHLARMIFHRLLLRRRDRVVAVGESVRQALVRNEGILAKRICVIYNGVPCPRFQRDEAIRHRMRGELGVAEGDFVIMQVARLDPLKDLRTAVRAAGHLPGAHVRWFLVGEGPERPVVEAEIARLSLNERVRLLGERRDIPALLSAADAFVLTSISEGIPVTVLEAMAAGLPVVATRVGGLPEVVRDGETGHLVPAGDPLAVAQALASLMIDGGKARAWGDAAQRLVAERFSEALMHREYQRLLDEIILP